MTRLLDPAILDEMRADHNRLRYFCELGFDSGAERLWTGLGTIDTLGQTWYGVGSLASIDGLEEGVDLSPFALKLGLSRLDPALAQLPLTVDYHNREVILYVSAIDGDGQLVAPPGEVFNGYMVDCEATMGEPEGEVILLTCENELAILDRSASLRYTDVQLQSEYGGDLGLEYLDQVVDHRPVWRGKSQIPLGGATPGNTGGGRSSGEPSAPPFVR